MATMDPTRSKKEASKATSKKLLDRLGLETELTEHEAIIAGEVIDSNDINVQFEGTIH